MSEKKVVEVKEVFSDESIYGYLGGKKKVTPKVLSEMGVPKAKQFSAYIGPMSDEDCTAINSLNREESLKMTLWFSSEDGQKFNNANEKLKKFKGNTSEFTDADFDAVQLIVKKRSELSTDTQKFAIVQKYITDLSKPHPLSSKGIITDEAWGVMPKNIKGDFYNEIYDISMLNEVDAVNLQ